MNEPKENLIADAVVDAVRKHLPYGTVDNVYWGAMWQEIRREARSHLSAALAAAQEREAKLIEALEEIESARPLTANWLQFASELKHMATNALTAHEQSSQAPADDCGNCHRCLEGKLVDGPIPIPVTATRMILCPTCGNKRCPKATDHRLACTDSNEPGQPGSVYGEAPAQGEPAKLEPHARRICERVGLDPDCPAAPHGQWPIWYDVAGLLAAVLESPPSAPKEHDHD